MDFEKLAYPEIVTIAGIEYKGKRNMLKGQLFIPYTKEPDVSIGDIIIQKSGKRKIQLKVLDTSFLKDGSLEVSTNHPHKLTLIVENITAKPHIVTNNNPSISIGSINGEQIQVGNDNSQIVNINMQQLVEHIAKSNDDEAKSILKSLLKNNTVASLVGASATALFGLL
ncbi:hypothetical protein [Sulfurimonas sp.]|uniref:hypothetical protein n=1 Tax=Sulfurimonas sp. TaxID=2022749 RepID=UPI002AB16FA0|nr:hypothetical protein [Sulfurimonas sp.]